MLFGFCSKKTQTPHAQIVIDLYLQKFFKSEVLCRKKLRRAK